MILQARQGAHTFAMEGDETRDARLAKTRTAGTGSGRAKSDGTSGAQPRRPHGTFRSWTRWSRPTIAALDQRHAASRQGDLFAALGFFVLPADTIPDVIFGLRLHRRHRGPDRSYHGRARPYAARRIALPPRKRSPRLIVGRAMGVTMPCMAKKSNCLPRFPDFQPLPGTVARLKVAQGGLTG